MRKQRPNINKVPLYQVRLGLENSSKVTVIPAIHANPAIRHRVAITKSFKVFMILYDLFFYLV